MKKFFLYLIVIISGLISGGPLVAVMSFFTLKYLIKKNKWFSGYEKDSTFEDYIDEYPDDIDKEERKIKKNQSDYYSILGCSPTDSIETIKNAYRKKISEFHPDKIQGKGLSQEFIDFANEQAKKINEAYESILKTYR